jgi:hypothetical protein
MPLGGGVTFLSLRPWLISSGWLRLSVCRQVLL